MVVTLEEQDMEMIQLLVNMGFVKNVAKTLVYIVKANETVSAEIEAETNLRQPEVSIAIRELKKRGWIVKKDLKRESKGRPAHCYKLAVPFSKIIETIENDALEKIKKIQTDLTRLKSLVK
ncbi:MAG: ArsR family transcriptional regulator [Candidatus Thermoplasmatota archaeon]